jgi:hypothetical protein
LGDEYTFNSYVWAQKDTILNIFTAIASMAIKTIWEIYSFETYIFCDHQGKGNFFKNILLLSIKMEFFFNPPPPPKWGKMPPKE